MTMSLLSIPYVIVLSTFLSLFFVVYQPPPMLPGKRPWTRFSFNSKRLIFLLVVTNVYFTVLKKSPIVPKVPMKPLYWTRIVIPSNVSVDTSPSETSASTPLWAQIDEIPIDDLTEFTDLFSRQVVNTKPKTKPVEVKSKIEPIKILDSKRSQNVGILAQSLHVDMSEIENAIYGFNTSVVSLEALQQIFEMVSLDVALNSTTY